MNSEPSNPLDFVKAELSKGPNPAALIKPTEPVNNVVPAPVVANVVTSTPESVVDAIVNDTQNSSEPVPLPPVAPPIAPEPVAPVEEPKPEALTAEDLLGSLEPKKKAKEDSLRDLKNVLKSKDEELTTVSSRLSELEAELAKYKAGEVVPESTQSKLDRMAELERYEKLHNLKASPEFYETVVKPKEAEVEKLKAHAEQYKATLADVLKANEFTDPRAKNQYLRKFFDDVGALEAKNILDNINKFDGLASQMETQPDEALAKIYNDIELQKAEKIRQDLANMSSVAETGWANSLGEVRSEGHYPELTLKEGNEDHNKVARPIIENAAREFGKFVNWLATLGVREIPVEAAKLLAKRFQLSEAALVISKSRDHFYNEAQKIITENNNNAKFARPPIGGTMPTSSVSTSAPRVSSSPMPLEQVGENLINDILRSRTGQ